MRKRALISACLLGVDCKYDGGSNRLPDEKLARLKTEYELIPVCPEAYGGLTTPRTPSERFGDGVVSKPAGMSPPSFKEAPRRRFTLRRFLI